MTLTKESLQKRMEVMWRKDLPSSLVSFSNSPPTCSTEISFFAQCREGEGCQDESRLLDGLSQLHKDTRVEETRAWGLPCV